MPRLRVSILEAVDLEKELMRGIKEKIGAHHTFMRGEIDLDLKVKGTPFLQIDINHVNFRMITHADVKATGFFIREFGLVNVEKREPKNILISSSHDIYSGSIIKKSFDELDQSFTPRKRNPDPEEED